MYDRSLDAFAPYHPPSPLSLYPSHTDVWPSSSNLGEAYFGHVRGNFPELPGYPPLRPDTLKFPGGYAFGGPGRRNVMAMAKASAQSVDAAAPASAPVAEGFVAGQAREEVRLKDEGKARAEAPGPIAIRADFSETAFWKPQLLTGPGRLGLDRVHGPGFSHVLERLGPRRDERPEGRLRPQGDAAASRT